MTVPPPDDVSDLLASARAGDVAAFSTIMEAEQSRLMAQALAFCGNAQAAQDLVQETIIAAWKSLPRFDGSCRLFTWLYVILGGNRQGNEPRLEAVVCSRRRRRALLAIVATFARREPASAHPDIAAVLASTQSHIASLSVESSISALPPWTSPTASLLEPLRNNQ